LLQRCEGALVGLAIGEALGRLAGEAGQEISTALLLPGADTAMTLAVAESLLQRQGYDPKDQLQRYQDWVQAADAPLVPPELKRALATWKWSRKLIAGSHDPKNVDAHTLARTLGVVLYRLGEPASVIELASEVSRATLQSPVVLDACRLWGAALLDALLGQPRDAILSFASPLLQQVRARKLRTELDLLLLGEWEHLVGSSVQAVLGTVLRAVQTTGSFKDGALQAVSAARQRSTCGALYGALAGALYGVEQIPVEWRSRLPLEPTLLNLAQRCAALVPTPTS
jgi:ADP-ribosyl-[dinitrogen reductase] hydrolase